MAPKRPKFDELDPNYRKGREIVILGNLPQLIPCYITRLRRGVPTTGHDMAVSRPPVRHSCAIQPLSPGEAVRTFTMGNPALTGLRHDSPGLNA